MRLNFLCLVLLLAGWNVSAQVPTIKSCAELHLVPAVRECMPPLSATFAVNLNLDRESYQDETIYFAVRDLAASLKEAGVKLSPKGTRIEFLDVESVRAKAILEKKKLHFDAAMNEEGYILTDSDSGSVAVIARTATGFFYGAQTLKQMSYLEKIKLDGNDALAPALHIATIRDWPAMAHRGVSDDWSRGPLPNVEFLKREIRTLAAYKINLFSPYFEHTFAYNNAPVSAFPGGALTQEEAKELVACAAQYHITIVPEQESFGHLHHFLKYEQYSHLGETEHGAVLAPGDAQTLPQIKSWFEELAQVFPGPWVHIGADETFELGLGRTRDEVKARGLGPVYLNFLTQIHDTLASSQKKILFWGDIAGNSPELVGTLPKDMIAVPWVYDPQPDYRKTIEPFQKAGLETWVAPGVSNWSRIYPNNQNALLNIRNFVRDGQLMGSTGVLNTVWNDDGETIFDSNWFGILFGAAAGWQPGESNAHQFTDAYAQAFHRDATGKLSGAQRELMEIDKLLYEAKLGDAQDEYFWADPFSPSGQKLAAQFRPVLRPMRLHAEKAIQLIAEARSAARAEHRVLMNEEAIDALELGARRIDFLGLKFQAADEMASMYAQALALSKDPAHRQEVEDLLESIGSMNGRVQDIRDGYALLRDLYQQAWLRDNRPYWLQNNLARYDNALHLWVERSDRWQQVLNGWWEEKKLPPAAEMGLPEAAAK
jgi:hypothetical protein